MKKKTRYYVGLIVAALILVLAGCGSKDEDVAKDTKDIKKETVNYADKVKENPIVTITLENEKKITIELEPKVAPNTVANFIALAHDGFYDGLIFHRVIPGFMIQGGDPTGTGTGGPDYAIKGEFSNNDFTNDLLHERGVISMARSQDADSAGSQFFIMVAPSTQLDGDYAVFGKVTSGMEAVDDIVNTKTNSEDKPLKEQKMKTVEVDTKGFDYPKPEVIK
ncbi:MAG: peptidylprolyl isomerase [Kurthia sp.]|nr:peptidylprolyl isomerase [Candidatus Kurthia equi]